MSRFADGYEADYNNAGELWMNRVRLAFGGKPGRKRLAELREALLALPEHRLIESAVCKPIIENEVVVGGEVCVIGAYLWHQKVKAGMDPVEAFGALPTIDPDYGNAGDQTARLGKAAGMTFTLAWELANQNDEEFGGYSPEERHAAFIRVIDEQLARPPLEAAPRRPKHERPPPAPWGARGRAAARTRGRIGVLPIEIGL